MESFPLVRISDIPPDNVKVWKFTTIFKDSIMEGKTLIWSIGFNGSELVTIHGQEGGAMQENRREIVPKAGRNMNEQAHQEARRRYIDKLREGYISGDPLSSEVVRSKAMLAQKYIVGKTKLDFPVACQAKIDGIRMLVTGNSTSLYCMSREGNEISNFSEVKKELKEFIMYLPPNTVIDGELFSRTLTFNEVSGIVRKKLAIDPRESQIQYHIFDINMNDLTPFEDRYVILFNAFKSYLSDLLEKKTDPAVKFDSMYGSANLRMLRSFAVYSHDEIIKYFNILKECKYEGIIIRKLGGRRTEKELKSSAYKGTRVMNLLKYKGDRDSEEMEIIGAKTGEGQEKDLVIWVVKDPRGNVIPVRPQGSFEQRRQYWMEWNKYVGKFLTVEYNGLSEYGVPRFPIGIEIRDYE